MGEVLRVPGPFYLVWNTNQSEETVMESNVNPLLYGVQSYAAADTDFRKQCEPFRAEAADPMLAAMLMALRGPIYDVPANYDDLAIFTVFCNEASLERRPGLLVAAITRDTACVVAAAHLGGCAPCFELPWADSKVRVHYLIGSDGLYV